MPWSVALFKIFSIHIGHSVLILMYPTYVLYIYALCIYRSWLRVISLKLFLSDIYSSLLLLVSLSHIILFILLFLGIPYQQKSVHLKCVVECFPLCEIIWHKNNTPIPISNKRSLGGGVYRGSGQLDMYSRFSVKTEHKKANSIDNVLEHVQSVLTLVRNNFV